MLMIRLQRTGKKKQAFFRLVLQEKTWKTKGKAIELLGFFNPHTKEKKFQDERIKHWISKGAQLSPTAHNMLVDAKVIDGPKVKAWAPKKKTKQEGAKTDAAAPTPEGQGSDSSDDVGKSKDGVPVKEVEKEDTKEEPAKTEEEPKETPAKADATEIEKEDAKEDAPAEKKIDDTKQES